MQHNENAPRPRWRAVAVVLLLAAGTGGVVALTRSSGTGTFAVVEPASANQAAAVPAGVPSTAARATGTPYEKAVESLRLHTNGLLDGDEGAWLGAVDPAQPALVRRYRGLFGSLRGLGVTEFEYVLDIGRPDRKNPAVLSFRTRIWYCFGSDTCQGNGDPPGLIQTTTMKPVGGRYVISKVTNLRDDDLAIPVPWQDGRLVLAEGARVTVAASPAEARHLATVLPLAEKAAAVTDRFAAMLTTTQTRYRVFLAGEKQWKTWYGGNDEKWVLGLATRLNETGVDVVLRINAIRRDELRMVLQHELGHVVTLTGATLERTADHGWLAEGIAEYIGSSPAPATASPRRSSVRWAIANQRPSSMIPVRPPAKASLRTGDAYYGLSHFAVDCMAREYGQKKLFAFVRRVLTFSDGYDDAARQAFGVPFATVDKACRTWIRRAA